MKSSERVEDLDWTACLGHVNKFKWFRLQLFCVFELVHSKSRLILS